MNVLLIGSGGREHALAWKLAQSPLLTRLHAAPGNPGMAEIAQLVPLKANDVEGIVAYAVREKIDLAVIGPEEPLSLGLADRLEESGIPCFGPKARSARLESSKRFAKDFMTQYGIPTASYRAFSSIDDARRYVETLTGPAVVKADGLAQGKGVVVASGRQEALEALGDMEGGRFGGAGLSVVIEEMLAGEEVSLLTFSDGENLFPMLPVQDHKRVGEGDTGPNTGGMGAYTPVSVFTPDLARTVEDTIISPLLKGLREENMDYRGCLYIGLMLTPDGPKVIEFNARFGDPETQVLMPMLKSDLLDIAYSCAKGKLAYKPEWRDGSTVCVVVASGGYPGSYPTGRVIHEDPVPVELANDSWVYHAGTAQNGELVTSGGRVLGITAYGKTINKALERAYARAAMVRFEGGFFRRDIGYREVKRL